MAGSVTKWYKGYNYVVSFDPDEIWPTLWKAIIYRNGSHCRTIHATSIFRAERKAERSIRRRIRRIERNPYGP